ncbi:SDR family NAD(P)-dependent oxidoreductase [Rhodococcus sp. SORGH_AS_0301]|uniref:SDR family NAD(P)-dependent oxidoreductase n=1 Tax=Rhodococcus sp. SORGH_AS_0301 TaxID=3041780 RepID=UPI00277F1E53|nr:SDR family oxidoreductase [Rhodococcus sp. SORGH_AS_0301]MDQ1178587.1 3-oxoacyl-[acyl-carrier protein] reductase [Rhodococcus sp. SORGH_AS_0301]
MTDVDILKEVGFDRAPHGIAVKKVSELMDMTGKRTIVTGAGGPGLGRAIAHRLAGLGATVVLADRNLDGAKGAASEITERWGTKTFAVECDVTDWDDAHRFIANSNDLMGGIDVLVNNVGAGEMRAFKDQDRAGIDNTIALGFVDTVYCSRAVLDYMIPQKSGHIINIAAGAGRSLSPRGAVYGAAKAGVIQFTRNLAYEVGKLGVRVNGVSPGIMLHAELREVLANHSTEWDYKWRMDRIDLDRVSIPEEVANVVAFVASDAGSYLSGVTINADGGVAAMG